MIAHDHLLVDVCYVSEVISVHVSDMARVGIGGIAYGVDRLAMMLAGKETIRDVIAFPKSTTAQCLLTRAPSSVDAQQLRELSLQTLPNDKK